MATTTNKTKTTTTAINQRRWPLLLLLLLLFLLLLRRRRSCGCHHHHRVRSDYHVLPTKNRRPAARRSFVNVTRPVHCCHRCNHCDCFILTIRNVVHPYRCRHRHLTPAFVMRLSSTRSCFHGNARHRQIRITTTMNISMVQQTTTTTTSSSIVTHKYGVGLPVRVMASVEGWDRLPSSRSAPKSLMDRVGPPTGRS